MRTITYPPGLAAAVPFTFEPTDLPDVVLVTPKRFGDDRGWFMETFRQDDFAAAGIPGPWVQDNHSCSGPVGTLRGIHYQLAPRAQGKLVRCTAGAVLDVAIDLRPDAPTFRRHVAERLDPDGRMIWIPPGFGHAFCTLEPGTEVVYKTTATYDAGLDRAIRWDDPELAIPWPTDEPVLSPKDASAPLLADAELRWS